MDCQTWRSPRPLPDHPSVAYPARCPWSRQGTVTLTVPEDPPAQSEPRVSRGVGYLWDHWVSVRGRLKSRTRAGDGSGRPERGRPAATASATLDRAEVRRRVRSLEGERCWKAPRALGVRSPSSTPGFRTTRETGTGERENSKGREAGLGSESEASFAGTRRLGVLGRPSRSSGLRGLRWRRRPRVRPARLRGVPAKGERLKALIAAGSDARSLAGPRGAGKSAVPGVPCLIPRLQDAAAA